ncbi:KxYKxGKxW signal peptide domain-containing protein [Streptococcus halichoeri]|uniref:KxYKxGKxW signal peptide domain-containing protein n=1 Tax=Streptococcus halichoeri TaxID=254785 RepID=UPI001356C08B|nr:KxYKxGKxW signal peptide domain-containing protein [Streptococcus halichoeri]
MAKKLKQDDKKGESKIMEKRESTKIGFRMWKSGKRWLFSGIALAATLMIGTSAISADVNVDGALTDHKDICLKVHDLHNEDEDKHQCVFWYPGYPEGEMTPPTRPTDDAHPDKEIIGPFGGGSTSTWHGSGYVEETGGRVKPTKPTSEGLQTDEDARRHKSSLPENVVQSKSALTSPVTVLSATGVTTLIAVGAFSIKKIWKK